MNLQSQHIISMKITSTIQPSLQPLGKKVSWGERNEESLPLQHRFWDITNWTAQTPSAELCPTAAQPLCCVQGRALLPPDVLLQVKVLGKGLVTVCALQLGGLGFA